MMYLISFVRRSTHITPIFMIYLCSTIMSIQIFFRFFFSGKCRSMKIPKLGNTRYEKKIFKKKLDFFYNRFQDTCTVPWHVAVNLLKIYSTKWLLVFWWLALISYIHVFIYKIFINDWFERVGKLLQFLHSIYISLEKALKI